MKNKLLLLFNILILFGACKTYIIPRSDDVSAAFLTVMPYTSIPFYTNEVSIHFQDENSCSQLRINAYDIDSIIRILEHLKPTKQNTLPAKYGKYVKVWIGLQFANEKRRYSLGITHNGLIKMGNHFFAKDDELLSIIFQQKIHLRILETIPRDSIWGKFLTHK